MNKTFLITGATGLTGGYILKSLLERGDKAAVLTSSPETAGEKLPASVRTIVPWKNYMKLADEKIGVIINLAGRNIGEKRWSEKVKKQIYDSRIITTRKLIELIKRMKVKPETLINASGSDYYGDRGNEPVTEESPPGTGFLSELCIDWEKEAYNAEDYGVRVVVIRNGFVMAKNAPALKKLALPFRLFAGSTAGSGKQYMSWIHVRDLVRIYLLAADRKEIRGAVNAVSPNPVTMKEFCKNIAVVLRRPSYLHVPSFLVKLVFGEMGSVVLNGRRAYPEKLIQAGFKFEFEQSLPALRDVLL